MAWVLFICFTFLAFRSFFGFFFVIVIVYYIHIDVRFSAMRYSYTYLTNFIVQFKLSSVLKAKKIDICKIYRSHAYIKARTSTMNMIILGQKTRADYVGIIMIMHDKGIAEACFRDKETNQCSQLIIGPAKDSALSQKMTKHCSLKSGST